MNQPTPPNVTSSGKSIQQRIDQAAHRVVDSLTSGKVGDIFTEERSFLRFLKFSKIGAGLGFVGATIMQKLQTSGGWFNMLTQGQRITIFNANYSLFFKGIAMGAMAGAGTFLLTHAVLAVRSKIKEGREESTLTKENSHAAAQNTFKNTPATAQPQTIEEDANSQKSSPDKPIPPMRELYLRRKAQAESLRAAQQGASELSIRTLKT